MTNPQDPNQPGQPEAPAPQGWGQPDPNQPGWAAPQQQPPSQPGWGAPPPQQPPAGQGWGAPPPAQPGWGAPPAPGYQPAPGWGAPVPPKKKGHGCLIAFVIVLVIFLVGVGSCTAFVVLNVGPYVGTEMQLNNDLGARGTATIDVTNGHRTWIITLKSAYVGQADLIACGIIKADLKGTQFENDSIVIEDSLGNVLATGSSC
ncbi:MAG TPA: hypothetical protein VF337_05130 [Candidatus Limnocylindrales bacterium]